MPAVLTVVLAQLSPRLRQTKANIETIGRIVTEHPEADLVVFPELFLSGYTLSGIDEFAIQMETPLS
jgi:predicted amidohydrolase